MASVTMAAPSVNLETSSPPPLGPRARVLFLRVDFPDEPSKRPATDWKNPSRSGYLDRLVTYYDQVSMGRFELDAVMSDKVYRLPRPRRAYVNRPALMISDALRLAGRPEPEGELSLITRANPNVYALLFAGPGAESDIKRERQDLPWSNGVHGLPGRTSRGLVVAENPMHGLSPFGVLAHEFGHVLGLPELYAPGKPHEGIGIWGLMGQGTWVGMGDSPPHPCAWSKLHLGWADPIVVDHTQKVELPSVSRSGQVVKIYAKGREHPDEYFLIENRERHALDRNVPGEGLLIWHVDERLKNFRRSQDNARHKRVDLLTADSWPSHLDIGHAQGGNRGDAGDAWAGRDGPGPDTKPSTGAYDGSRGRFAIKNISAAGEVMTFDVVFEDERKQP